MWLWQKGAFPQRDWEFCNFSQSHLSPQPDASNTPQLNEPEHCLNFPTNVSRHIKILVVTMLVIFILGHGQRRLYHDLGKGDRLRGRNRLRAGKISKRLDPMS